MSHQTYQVYQDKEGTEISEKLFKYLISKEKYRVIAKDVVDDYEISTIWMGLPDEEGFLFDTFINLIGIYEENLFKTPHFKYMLLKEAIDGHKSVVDFVKDTIQRRPTTAHMIIEGIEHHPTFEF